MKIAIVIFTFGGDASCLGACLSALGRLRPREHELYLWVADDASHPLPYPPAEVEYVRTDFDRRGNLNGRACVEGMLDLMSDAARRTKADYVVKLDCDTVVNAFDWIAPDAAMSGWLLAPDKDYCSGMCYAIRADVLDAMCSWVRSHAHFLAHNVPEDIGMGCVCRAVGGSMALHQVYEEGKRACGYVYNGQQDEGGVIIERPCWPPYGGMEVVTFGNRNYIPEAVPDKRDYAASMMHAYLDYMGGQGCQPKQA